MFKTRYTIIGLFAILCLIISVPASAENPQPSPAADTCLGQNPGDANSDGTVDIGDSRYLIGYLCLSLPAPDPLSNGDANGDCIIDSLDVAYIVAFLFQGGPAPVECTCVEPAVGDCWSDSCEFQFPGDANADGFIDVADSKYLINYLCLDGPAPNPLPNGDPNGDCVIDSLDIDYIVQYIFQGGPAPVDCTCLLPVKGDCWVDSCTYQNPGDANGDGFIDIADARYLVNYVCLGGPPPEPPANGDPNGDCIIDSLDIDHIVQYIFQGGPSPVDCTCEEPITGECWVDTCEIQFPGDANGDDKIDVSDAVYLAQYLCTDAPAPPPLANGDPNGDCVIDSLDLEYLISLLFKGGPAPVDCTCLFPEKGDCPQYNCGGHLAGESNGDMALNVGDAVYLLGYIFKGGPEAKPYYVYSGDANCDCAVNIGDVVWIINYVFKSGPAPCSCQEWLDHCGPPLR